MGNGFIVETREISFPKQKDKGSYIDFCAYNEDGFTSTHIANCEDKTEKIIALERSDNYVFKTILLEGDPTFLDYALGKIRENQDLITIDGTTYTWDKIKDSVNAYLSGDTDGIEFFLME